MQDNIEKPIKPQKQYNSNKQEFVITHYLRSVQIQQRLQDYRNKQVMGQMVEKFNLVNNPVLNNNNFIKQFPKFSFEYAQKFASYKEISNDNKIFTDEYDNHSLYKKVPQPYQKLMHNYGSTDYKELDPKINNLFQQIPQSQKILKQKLSTSLSQKYFGSPKGSMNNTQAGAFLGAMLQTPMRNIQSSQVKTIDKLDSEKQGQFLSPPQRTDIKDGELVDGDKNHLQVPGTPSSFGFSTAFEFNKQQRLASMTTKSRTTQNLKVRFNQGREGSSLDARKIPATAQAALLPNDPQYILNENITRLKGLITSAYMKSREDVKKLEEDIIQSARSPKSSKSGRSAKSFPYNPVDIERLQRIEDSYLKLMEAAVALELRNLLKYERSLLQNETQTNQELHTKVLHKKLQKIGSQKQIFRGQQTLVGLKFIEESINELEKDKKNIRYKTLGSTISSLPNLKVSKPNHKYMEVFKNAIIYSKEELVFHELQHQLTKLTSNKSNDLTFQQKFEIIEKLKRQCVELKRMIDKNNDDENPNKHPSLIKIQHVTLVEEMILQLEKNYQNQIIEQSKKKIQRQNLLDELLELQNRDNQLRNVDFKFQKFYQKNVDDIREMKDYLQQVKDLIRLKFEKMLHSHERTMTNSDIGSSVKDAFHKNSTDNDTKQRSHKKQIQKKNVRFSTHQRGESIQSLLNKQSTLQKGQTKLFDKKSSPPKENDEDYIRIELQDKESLRESVSKTPSQHQFSPTQRSQRSIMKSIDGRDHIPERNSIEEGDEEENDQFQSQDFTGTINESQALSAEHSHIHIPGLVDEEIDLGCKDFDNIEEMIREYFNPLSQNKQILQQAETMPFQKKKTIRSKTTLDGKASTNNINEMQILDDLAKLEMKEIGKTEELQKLIKKSTSQNKDNLKNLSHHYVFLRKNLQKRLKDQDIEKLKSLSHQMQLDKNILSLSSSPKSGNSRTKTNKPQKKQKPLDFSNFLFHNIYGVQGLRILANEHGIMEALEQFHKKNGIYDDTAKDHMSRLKNYKTNLEVLERKFIQIAGTHYNL